MIKNNYRKQDGFALLMTIIVLGVVVSVGLTIVELTIKQVRLSANAKDSEIAFHAANAGVECGRFHRIIESATEIDDGDVLAPNCFDEAPDSAATNPLTISPAGDGNATQYVWEYTWGGSSAPRCSEITLVSLVANSTGPDTTLSGMEGPTGLVPGYPDGDVKTCGPGGLCTVLAVKGYNRPCSQKNSVGTLEREVLVQF